MKAGNEIIIRDRNLAVARLLPISGTETPDDELQRLAAQGKIHLGEGPIGDDYWDLKLPRVKTKVIKAPNVLQWLMDEERNED